jgi:16S rRNA processing protein RimM
VSSSESRADRLQVASIKRPHGLRGEIAVEPVGDFPERLSAGSHLTTVCDGAWISLTIAGARPHGTHVLLRFEGRDSRESVEPLSGGDLFADRSEFSPPSADFIFDDEVARFRCESASGELLGKALAFEKFGPNCCLRIDRGGRSFLVPFAHPIVREVLRDRGVIVLDPPEGLFDL